MLYRFHRHWKYLVVSGTVMVIIFLILFGVACYYRRSHGKFDPENPVPPCSRSGPPVTPYAPTTQPMRPKEHIVFPMKAHCTPGLSTHDLRSSSIPLPLARPQRDQSFVNSLRSYAEENEEREKLNRGKRSVPTLDTPGKSLEDMEKLIRERLRTTGRPGIPISVTAKMRRGV